MPSINGLNDVETNADGSVDLWFGPPLPATLQHRNALAGD